MYILYFSMPRDNIDYSNTIIYKIYCKNNSISDFYVGHTTNFIKRKHEHKISYNKSSNKLKIYETIRNNGGWENWDIVEIAKYNCKDVSEARIKEHEHLNMLKKNVTVSNNYDEKTKHTCKNCNKSYSARSSLWYHSKKCTNIIDNNLIGINDINIQSLKQEVNKDQIIDVLLKQNQEFKELLLDQNNKMFEMYKEKNSLQINNTNNSHNKTFNLQLFLNETCKDAMNLMDFVDSIKLQLSDLEQIGEKGFVNGITNIIVKNLKALDVDKRPVHCTDSKRETLYIKDDNKWEKENEEKLKIKKAIKRVANKNISLIPEFKAKYPDCIYSHSKRSDQYNKLIVEAFELSDPEKQDKIIRNITKEVIIDKKAI
jgi:hypothetical protein